jgi:hypothetical protein
MVISLASAPYFRACTVSSKSPAAGPTLTIMTVLPEPTPHRFSYGGRAQGWGMKVGSS